MKKFLKLFGYSLLIAFVVIQFFQPGKNEFPAYSGHRMHDAYRVPDDVNGILINSCNDCHSNNTKPMWYMNVQPIGWWISDHITEGKEELNFDEFAKYPLPKQYHKFEEIAEMVEEDEMPLGSYTFIHSRAELTEADKDALIDWANGMCTWMEETYPADSLVKK